MGNQVVTLLERVFLSGAGGRELKKKLKRYARRAGSNWLFAAALHKSEHAVLGSL